MYCFEALSLVDFDFILKVLWPKSLLASDPKGLKKVNFFSQGTGKCQNLRYECLIIVDPKYIVISSLAVLNIKL